MEIYYVNCPRCRGSFHCDANLKGLNLPRHCPHCDLYFEPEEETGRRPPRGTAFVGFSQIDREIIYIPTPQPSARGRGEKGEINKEVRK